MPIGLTNKADTNLHNLNEDCLLEMFSVDTLSVMDLCSLSETCTRFQKIVRRVFPTKLEITFRGETEYDVTSSKSSTSRTKKLLENQGNDDIEIILRNCGSSLCGLTINSYRDSSDERLSFLLNLVSKYCVDALESPDIDCEKVSEISTVKSNPIFNRRLQALVLNGINIRDGLDFFDDLESLIELTFENVTGCSPILETSFPKLKRFTFIDYRVDDFSLQKFITHHPRLKTLRIIVHKFRKNRTGFLQEIVSNCTELEELNLNIGSERHEYSLLPLQSLKRLKTLKLWYVPCNNLSFIPGMANLRELWFMCCSPPKDEIVHLTQLTKLRIYHRDHYVDVVDVIKRLINLEEFKVGYFTLKEKTFINIVEIVKGRPNVLTLFCSFDFSYDSKKYDENQRLRLIRSYTER